MKRFAFALALAAALPFAAQAAEFTQVQTDKSAITFGYQQMGVKMDGRFKKFAARLNFDPARPTDAKATSTSIWPASTPARRKPTRRSPANRGSTPRPSRLRSSSPAASRRSAATATKSPAS